VNTASVSGLGGDWAMAAYDASRGAIVNLTRAMAKDRKLVKRFMERMPLGRPCRGIRSLQLPEREPLQRKPGS
jgi:hypothetical protein